MNLHALLPVNLERQHHNMFESYAKSRRETSQVAALCPAPSVDAGLRREYYTSSAPAPCPGTQDTALGRTGNNLAARVSIYIASCLKPLEATWLEC